MCPKTTAIGSKIKKKIKKFKLANISASLNFFLFFFGFFLIFYKPAFFVGYIDKISIYRRYVIDINQYFPDFSNKRFLFAKIVSGWPYTRNIDDISSIFRDFLIPEGNQQPDDHMISKYSKEWVTSWLVVKGSLQQDG